MIAWAAAADVSVDGWTWVFLALLAAIAVAQLRPGARGGWHWWGPPTFALGLLCGVAAVVTVLDRLADDGSLSAHVAQHIALADIVAPLLLIGLAPRLRESLGRSYAHIASFAGRPARWAVTALSPAGAVVLWAAVTYVWLFPPIHRLAISDGVGQLLDHASFLLIGLVVWLAAFDFRRGSPVTDWETLKTSTTTCDLPWWARHVYAMVTRLAMLPAVALIWLVSSSAYFLPGQMPPGGQSQREDQVQAASMMLGFEILLSGLAVVLAFVFVSVSEGRARQMGERT